MSEELDWRTLRILCVDVDKGYCRLLDRVLRSLGARDIMLASTVEEARAQFDEKTFDFVFIGLSPDNELGTTLTGILRNKAETPAPNVPIIWMVSDGKLEVITTAISSGADHVLVKPISLGDVESTLKNLAANPTLKTDVQNYVGPCRRRLPSRVYGPFSGQDRRQSEPQVATG
jgi:DNA-binding NtrC family response regulator